MQLLLLFTIFKQNTSAFITFIWCINEYWFTFLGVTADMDSTSSSVHQASQFHESPKEKKLDFRNHYLLTRLLILNLNISKVTHYNSSIEV